MSKIVDMKKAKKKVENKKIIMDIILFAIIIYVTYAIYLIIKTSTDTIKVENRNFNSRRKCYRIYN